jgi:1,2-diacylglycerol 3-beta-galactosyltransferase
MSDTGGGHRASANALRDAFNVLHETDPERFPLPITCDIVDIYTDYGPFPYNMYVPAYKIMAEYTFLWKWFYETGATPLGLFLYDFVLELICFGPFKECMARDPANVGRSGGGRRADMVVSVHPLCQSLPLKVLASLDTDGASRSAGARTTPFVTVVTDLGGAHPSWFNGGVDRCFVPSDVLRDAALDRNVDSSRIVQYGLPIRRGFWRFGSDSDVAGGEAAGDIQKEARADMDKSAIRERLGLSDLPTVLIVGGGDGMGGIVSQAKAVGERLQKLALSSSSSLSSSSLSYQMVVVCGNNKLAHASLPPPEMQWGSDIDVRVQGFVNNLDEYMRASGD